MHAYLGKRGQLALFVIVGLAIIGLIFLFLFLSGFFTTDSSVSDLGVVYDTYRACIQTQAEVGISILGSQGGRIFIDTYESPSEYAPFSSELNFLGFPIPYWYYVSGNGLLKEQVPTRTMMEQDLKQYIEEGLARCDFSDVRERGYEASVSSPSATVSIRDHEVLVSVDAVLTARMENTTGTNAKHTLSVQSELGSLYKSARILYDKQKQAAFLENYSADVIRLYAPVTGVELSCAPKIWNTQEVYQEVTQALSANLAAIRLSSQAAKPTLARDKYFVVATGVSQDVRVLYLPDWPIKFEVSGEGVDQTLMIAQPVGTQAGLGMLGFCYAPYHFVYDVSFPTLIQVSAGDELFQFPVIVVIDKNLPRSGIYSELDEPARFDFCKYKTRPVSVSLYDTSLDPVEGNISYSCFDQTCYLGETNAGVFEGMAPGCLNGYLEARANSYVLKKQLFSSNAEVTSEFILEKEYPVTLDLRVGGKVLSGTAVISFNGPQTVSTALPEQNQIRISEGMYNVTVYVYGNSSVIIPASTKTECRNLPESGILGFFGSSKEQCFEISIPATTIDYALLGGGKSEVYLLPSQLEEGVLHIDVGSLPIPKTIEELQYNFESFDSMGVDIS